MAHVMESAKTARAKCRGCDRRIEKGEIRFGERVPNVFGEGDTTLWFHLRCAAYKRPEPFLEALPLNEIAGAEELAQAAQAGIEHRRLPRLHGAERAPTGRARCRCCRQAIERDAWRLALVYFEEYRFEPSGFIHASCAAEYFGTTDVVERVRYFCPDLDEQALESLRSACKEKRNDVNDPPA
jgi:hypothetical protein